MKRKDTTYTLITIENGKLEVCQYANREALEGALVSLKAETPAVVFAHAEEIDFKVSTQTVVQLGSELEVKARGKVLNKDGSERKKPGRKKKQPIPNVDPVVATMVPQNGEKKTATT